MHHLTHFPSHSCLIALCCLFPPLFCFSSSTHFLLFPFFPPAYSFLNSLVILPSLPPTRPHAGLCWGGKVLGPIWARFHKHLLADSPPCLSHCHYSWPLYHITDMPVPLDARCYTLLTRTSPAYSDSLSVCSVSLSLWLYFPSIPPLLYFLFPPTRSFLQWY